MKYEDLNYISSEVLIAEVKQELKSYFEAGAISEVLVPTFIDQALRKLKVMVLKPEEVVLNFHNYKSELPPDFALLDRAVYYDSDIIWSQGVTSMKGSWYKSITTSDCDSTPHKEEIYEIVSVPTPGFRITMRNPTAVRVYHGSKAMCTEGCENLSVGSQNVIQIFPNKKVSASFEEGCIYVRYFSRPMDDDGLPMIPENLEVEEYIKAYLKFKFFEILWHSILDESQKQVEAKLQYYKRDQLAKLEAAWASLLSKSKQQLADSVAKTRKQFIKYHIQ